MSRRPRENVEPPESRRLDAHGWLQVLRRTRYQMANTNLSLLAAGAAFWAFLAIFPAVIAIVTVYGMVASPASVTRAVSKLGSSVSPSAKKTLTQWMNGIVDAHHGTLGIALVVSVLLLLWSVSSSVQNLMTGMTAAYEQEETRGFAARRGIALLLTVGALVLAVVMIASASALPALDRALGAAWLTIVASVAVYLAMGAVLFLSIAVLHRLAPANGPADWAWSLRGSRLSTALVLLTLVAFSMYVRFFSSYNKTYGALAGVVVFMLVINYSIYVVFAGALINAEAQRQVTGATAAETYPEASPDNVRSGDGVQARR